MVLQFSKPLCCLCWPWLSKTSLFGGFHSAHTFWGSLGANRKEDFWTKSSRIPKAIGQPIGATFTGLHRGATHNVALLEELTQDELLRTLQRGRGRVVGVSFGDHVLFDLSAASALTPLNQCPPHPMAQV